MRSSREKLVFVVALSAVALMAAGAVFWGWKHQADDAPLGPGAAYDLSAYVKARSVGQWRLVSRMDSPLSFLKQTYCLAVSGDGCIAFGYDDGDVAVFMQAPWNQPEYLCEEEDVEILGTSYFGGAAKFENPWSGGGRVLSLAFDADGVLFAGLPGGVAVRRDWRWEEFLDRPGSRIVSLVVTEDMIFAADAASRVVLCLDREGNVVREIDGRDGADEADSAGFVLPSPHWAMAMGPDGLLRIANPGRRRVEAWTVDGHREFVWGRGGPGVGQFSGCCNPAALAVLDDGRIVTVEKGDLLTVTVFEPDGPQAGTAGEVSCVVAGPDRFTVEDGAVSLAVLPDGTVLVLQTPGGVLSVFEPPPRGAGEARGAGVSPARPAGILPASGEEIR